MKRRRLGQNGIAHVGVVLVALVVAAGIAFAVNRVVENIKTIVAYEGTLVKVTCSASKSCSAYELKTSSKVYALDLKSNPGLNPGSQVKVTGTLPGNSNKSASTIDVSSITPVPNSAPANNSSNTGAAPSSSNGSSETNAGSMLTISNANNGQTITLHLNEKLTVVLTATNSTIPPPPGKSVSRQTAWSLNSKNLAILNRSSYTQTTSSNNSLNQITYTTTAEFTPESSGETSVFGSSSVSPVCAPTTICPDYITELSYIVTVNVVE